MNDLYREQILDHYRNPQNFGELTNPTVSIEDANVSCGDVIVMQAIIKNNTIVDIAFSGHSCAISTAAASLLTEKVKGETVEAVLQLTRDDIFSLLGVELTPARIKCALLPLEVLQKLVSQC